MTIHNALDHIGETIYSHFDEQNTLRDQAIGQSRLLTRDCSKTIRAIHRHEWEAAQEKMAGIQTTAEAFSALLADHPNLYYAGYTQDALKEYVEARLTYALIRDEDLPSHDELKVVPSTYINGLAEAATELRRYILDLMRHEDLVEAERLLQAMDAVYNLLVTFDFPDAITGGLRRRTDTVRGVLERTRGDLTITIQQQKLQRAVDGLRADLESARGQT